MSYLPSEPSLRKHPREETPEEAPKPNEVPSRKRANNKGNKVATQFTETKQREERERETLANEFVSFIDIDASQCFGEMEQLGQGDLLSRYEGQKLPTVEWANQTGFIVLDANVSNRIFRMMNGMVPGVMVKDKEEPVRIAIHKIQLEDLRNHLAGYKLERRWTFGLRPGEADFLRRNNIEVDEARDAFLIYSAVIPDGFATAIFHQQKMPEILHLIRQHNYFRKGLWEILSKTKQIQTDLFPNDTQARVAHVNPNEHPRQSNPQGQHLQPSFPHQPQNGTQGQSSQMDGPSFSHHLQNGGQRQHLQMHPPFLPQQGGTQRQYPQRNSPHPPQPLNGAQEQQLQRNSPLPPQPPHGQYLQMNHSFPLPPQNHSMMQSGPSQGYSMQTAPFQSYNVPRMPQNSRIPAHSQRIAQYAQSATQMPNRYPPPGLTATGSMHQVDVRPVYYGTGTSTTPSSRPLSTVPAQIAVPQAPLMHHLSSPSPQINGSTSNGSGYNQTSVMVPGNMQTPQTWPVNGTNRRQIRDHTPLPTVKNEQTLNDYGQQVLGRVQHETPMQSFDTAQAAVQEGAQLSYQPATTEVQLDDFFDLDYGAYSMPTNEGAVAGSSTGAGTIEGDFNEHWNNHDA